MHCRRTSLTILQICDDPRTNNISSAVVSKHILLLLRSRKPSIIVGLSPVHAVAENCDCRRKRRLSPKTARQRRQSPNSATVALFCDSRCFRRQIVAEIGDYNFGDYSRQCGQAFIRQWLACWEAVVAIPRKAPSAPSSIHIFTLREMYW